jgi:hypothetical protein
MKSIKARLARLEQKQGGATKLTIKVVISKKEVGEPVLVRVCRQRDET